VVRGELVGEVDAVLNGGDGRAGELHGIMAKLLEVMVWFEKERGELSTAARSGSVGRWRSRESSRAEERRRQQRAREGVEEVEKRPGACFKTRRGHGEQ
jgi:hypothetical protein